MSKNSTSKDTVPGRDATSQTRLTLEYLSGLARELTPFLSFAQASAYERIKDAAITAPTTAQIDVPFGICVKKVWLK
jgi:hypothetical protein